MDLNQGRLLNLDFSFISLLTGVRSGDLSILNDLVNGHSLHGVKMLDKNLGMMGFNKRFGMYEGDHQRYIDDVLEFLGDNQADFDANMNSRGLHSFPGDIFDIPDIINAPQKYRIFEYTGVDYYNVGESDMIQLLADTEFTTFDGQILELDSAKQYSKITKTDQIVNVADDAKFVSDAGVVQNLDPNAEIHLELYAVADFDDLATQNSIELLDAHHADGYNKVRVNGKGTETVNAKHFDSVYTYEQPMVLDVNIVTPPSLVPVKSKLVIPAKITITDPDTLKEYVHTRSRMEMAQIYDDMVFGKSTNTHNTYVYRKDTASNIGSSADNSGRGANIFGSRPVTVQSGSDLTSIGIFGFSGELPTIFKNKNLGLNKIGHEVRKHYKEIIEIMGDDFPSADANDILLVLLAVWKKKGFSIEESLFKSGVSTYFGTTRAQVLLSVIEFIAQGNKHQDLGILLKMNRAQVDALIFDLSKKLEIFKSARDFFPSVHKYDMAAARAHALQPSAATSLSETRILIQSELYHNAEGVYSTRLQTHPLSGVDPDGLFDATRLKYDDRLEEIASNEMFRFLVRLNNWEDLSKTEQLHNVMTKVLIEYERVLLDTTGASRMDLLTKMIKPVSTPQIPASVASSLGSIPVTDQVVRKAQLLLEGDPFVYDGELYRHTSTSEMDLMTTGDILDLLEEHSTYASMTTSFEDLNYMYTTVRDYYYGDYEDQLSERLNSVSELVNVEYYPNIPSATDDINGYNSLGHSIEYSYDYEGNDISINAIFVDSFTKVALFDVGLNAYIVKPVFSNGMLNPDVFMNQTEIADNFYYYLNSGKLPISFEQDISSGIFEKVVYLNIIKEKRILQDQMSVLYFGYENLEYLSTLGPNEIDQLIRLYEKIDTSITLENLGIKLVDLEGDNIPIGNYFSVLEDVALVSNYEKLIPDNYSPILLDRAINTRLQDSFSLDIDSNGRISKSIIRNVLGINPSHSIPLESLLDTSIWSYLDLPTSVFNGYIVTNDHSLYTNQYQTSASYLHHYFGEQTTRDLSDGGLIIAVRNMEAGILKQYSNLPFDKNYDFFGLALEYQKEGVSFWKAHGLAFIKSFSTRSSAATLPLDHRMWMDMMMDNVQIASYQNLLIFNKFAKKFITPIDT